MDDRTTARRFGLVLAGLCLVALVLVILSAIIG